MRKHINRRLAAAIESLEPRRMLATFTGTSGNDIIEISTLAHLVQVTINGVNHFSSDSDIFVNAGAGNDTFRVLSTLSGKIIRLNGEGGNDLCFNPQTLDLDAVYVGTTIFNGGPGSDFYVADNSNDSTTAVNIDITATAIRKSNHGAISLFSEIELLDYRDSHGSNRIGFTDMWNGTQVVRLTIIGNGGNDVITNTDSGAPTAGNWATSVGSAGMIVDGGAGTNTLLLNNSVGPGGNQTFNSNSISLTGVGLAGTLAYASINSIDFVGSSAADVVNLHSKPSGVSLRFDSGAGNDTFNIGDGDLDSDGWRATTLVGGNGVDSLNFLDHLDADATGETENYTLGGTSLVKGAMTIAYNGFETQSLHAANGIDAGTFPTVPVVNLNSVASTITSTTIVGAPDRGTIVNVANGDLATIVGGVTLNGVHTVNVNDQNAGGVVNAYSITDTQLRRDSSGHIINHSSVTRLTLNASNIFDAITISRTPPNMMLTVNGNAGNDIFTFGEGNISANFGGPVVLNGGAGTDSLTIANGSDTTLATQTLTATSFTDGFTHSYSGIESLRLNEGPGGTDLVVNSIGIPTTINGGSGEDHFTVGGGDIDDNIPPSTSAAPALIINGGDGNDFILFNDLDDTVTTVDRYTFERPGGVDHFRKTDVTDHVVRWGNIEQVTLDASDADFGGTSTITVLDVATSLRINGNGGNDFISVRDAAAPVFVHTGLGGADGLDVNSDTVLIPVTVVIDQSDDLESAGIFVGGTLRVAEGVVVSTGNLFLRGVLDLAGGALLSRAGSPDDLRPPLVVGHNGGSWNGFGAPGGVGAINSSLAAATPFADGVGYGLGSDIAPTTIGPFSIAPGDTLLRYTLDGDADLNQQVSLADFNRLASNFGQANRVWTHGDSNYDGTVNLADFNALAGNFGHSAAASAPAILERPFTAGSPDWADDDGPLARLGQR